MKIVSLLVVVYSSWLSLRYCEAGVGLSLFIRDGLVARRGLVCHVTRTANHDLMMMVLLVETAQGKNVF